MRPGALETYEHALRTGSELALCTTDGRLFPLAVDRWLGAADGADLSVVDRCDGATLDVGCGPGRIVRALAHRGVVALGVDIARRAVELSTECGGAALPRDVFGRLPGEGRWRTVLLMDGNIGIGGDPMRLLLRARDLLAGGGRLIVEACPDLAGTDIVTARLHSAGRIGPPFPWARVGPAGIRAHAAEAGYDEVESWSIAAREFIAFLR
jgi:SAM-dependent methyltransferase